MKTRSLSTIEFNPSGLIHKSPKHECLACVFETHDKHTDVKVQEVSKEKLKTDKELNA